MKRLPRLLCLAALILLCAAVFLFLSSFTAVKSSAQYLNWEESYYLSEDGRRIPFGGSLSITDAPGITGVYCFSAQLPELSENGYLLFEVSGEELTLSLNGREIYRSSSVTSNKLNMARANIPLSAGT